MNFYWIYSRRLNWNYTATVRFNLIKYLIKCARVVSISYRNVTMTEVRSVRSKSEDPAIPPATVLVPAGMKSFLAMNERAVEDMTLNFFYKPHTITLLFSSICAAIYFAFIRQVAWNRYFLSISASSSSLHNSHCSARLTLRYTCFCAHTHKVHFRVFGHPRVCQKYLAHLHRVMILSYW